MATGRLGDRRLAGRFMQALSVLRTGYGIGTILGSPEDPRPSPVSPDVPPENDDRSKLE